MTLDVTDEASIKSASREVAEIVGDTGLDYILNNAGVVRDNFSQNFKVLTQNRTRAMMMDSISKSPI